MNSGLNSTRNLTKQMTNDKASRCCWFAYQEKRLGEMGLGKMRIGEMRLGRMRLSEMRLGEMRRHRLTD